MTNQKGVFAAGDAAIGPKGVADRDRFYGRYGAKGSKPVSSLQFKIRH